MIHADEDCEGLERVQLDDYDDYLLDPLDDDVDETMDRESSSNIKGEDADKIKKEHRRLINAKRAQRRHRAVKTNQQGSRNFHDFSTVTFEPSSMLAGTLAISSLPGSWSAKKWKPIAPPATNTLSSTWRLLGSAKPKAGEQSTYRKKTPSSKKRLEEVLHG
jgi:hypothetical protein